jgi:uncharacterized membrane protein
MRRLRQVSVYPLLNMILLASFIGYVVENIFKLLMNGYIDNRYMFLPFLLGYGLFIAVIGVLIGTPQNLFPLSRTSLTVSKPLAYFVYFIISGVLVSAGELILGFVVERIGGFSYWDYSSLPLNFTKYTSLPTSLGFGLIITLFMGFVHDPAMRFFEKKKEARVWKIISVAAIFLLLLDFIVSFAVMISTGKRMLIWRLRIFAR